MLAFNESPQEIVVNYPGAPGESPTVYTFPARSLVDVPEGLTHRAARCQGPIRGLAFGVGASGSYGSQIENLTGGLVRPLDHELDGIRQWARRSGLLRLTDDLDEGKDAALAGAPHFQRITSPRVVMREGVRFDPGNTPFVINAAGQSLVLGVADLDNITISVVQVTEAGEADLALEISPDGVVWASVATYVETDFPAGDGAVIPETHSAVGGSGLPAFQFRLRCAAMAVAGGVYALRVAGLQRVGA